MQESQPFFHHDLILPMRLTTRRTLRHLDQRDDLSVFLIHSYQQLVLIHLFLSLYVPVSCHLCDYSHHNFCFLSPSIYNRSVRVKLSVQSSRKLSALFLLSSVLLGPIKWNKGKLGHELEAFQMRGETIHFLY